MSAQRTRYGPRRRRHLADLFSALTRSGITRATIAAGTRTKVPGMSELSIQWTRSPGSTPISRRRSLGTVTVPLFWIGFGPCSTSIEASTS